MKFFWGVEAAVACGGQVAAGALLFLYVAFFIFSLFLTGFSWRVVVATFGVFFVVVGGLSVSFPLGILCWYSFFLWNH